MALQMGLGPGTSDFGRKVGNSYIMSEGSEGADGLGVQDTHRLESDC